MTAAETMARAPSARFDFDAYVTAIAFGGPRGAVAAFALGDGTVRIVDTRAPREPVRVSEAHRGAVLAMAPLADGSGFLTGGDDGRLVRVGAAGESTALASFGIHWVGHIAAAHDRILCAVGRESVLLGLDGRRLASRAHPSTVEGVYIDARSKRIAVGHYDGVTIWSGANPDQQSRLLRWKGAHFSVTLSPDNRYVVSAMQENALHGWRLSDGAHFRMTDYDAKIRSFGWTRAGRYLATAGAQTVLCWPFFHKDGPMGRLPLELGMPAGPLVKVVAPHASCNVVASGYDNGHVILFRLDDDGWIPIAFGGRSPVSALAWSPDGTALAYGTESGEAALVDLSRSPMLDAGLRSPKPR